MTSCPRCASLLIDEYGDVRCIPCGWHYVPPFEPHEVKMDGRFKFCSWYKCPGEAVEGRESCQHHLDYFFVYDHLRRKRAA